MVYGVMNRMAYWIIAIALCIQNGYTYAGPASTRQQRNLGYLPPFPGAADQADSLQQSSSIVETKHLLSYPTSYTTTTYKTNHISPDAFQTSPQLSAHKSISSYSRTYHNSYAPQPSGIGKHLPPPPTPAPLPSLIPKSVLEQFTSTSTSTFPSASGNSIDSSVSVQKSQSSQPSAQALVSSLPSLPSASSASSSSSSSSSPSAVDAGFSGSESTIQQTSVPPQSIIMFDSPSAVLTPSQNETIYAAKLLATSLLQAAGESPIEKLDGFNIVDANNIKENDLNSTDVVIVKAQKNAYIIPMKLPTSDTNPMAIQDLYNMRDKLDKAYTINQFIFIIKPEHINFLNKLV